MSRIAYVVHNLNDSAVVRRVAMFRAGGAEVVVAGFCRDAVAPSHVGGAPAVMLGHTRDAALAQRAARVLGVVARPAGLLEACRGADVIVARNLEALVPAVLARRRLNIGRLVYESLDIHRSLLGKGALPAIMRWIERRLTARADALIYSSPAFSRNYFTPVQHFAMPMLLVENKLLCLDAAPGEVPSPNAPPWRIGWFGNLRCKQTLRTLAELARNSEGRVEILIAGKASPAEFPDFVRQVDQPGLRFGRNVDHPQIVERSRVEL